MQTDSNHPNSSNVTSTNSNSPPGKLLIPRCQRRKFVFLFTCMTIIGWIVGGITSIAIERILAQNLSTPGSFHWVSLLSNIVFAIVFAADQALVIRRYLPGRLWMIATSLGWLTANSVATAWINYIASIANSLNESLSPEVSVIFGLLSTIAYIFSGIWLGLFQWLVVRRYTTQAWWWSFVPSISFLLISSLVWLLLLLQNFIPDFMRAATLYVSQQGFTAIVLGVIPAISLCTLRRHLPRQTQVS